MEVAGFATAFRGMRNPKDSWDKADSDFENGVIFAVLGLVLGVM